MFQGMHYVYAVYREKSFSRAAAALYISQPSLSIMVKKEEERLGFPIFDRSTVPIRLTEPGEAYIRTAEKILELEQGFESYVNDFNELKEGSLYIGGTNLFVSYALPPLLARFSQLYPHVRIRLMEASSGELAEKLLSGELDLVLDNKHMPPEIYEKRLLCSERLLLAVPAPFSVNEKAAGYALSAADIRTGAHLSAEAKPVPLALFSNEPFLFMKPGNDTREREERLCRESHFEPMIRLELDQQSTAYNLSCAGLGISFITDTLICRVPENRELVYYKLDEAEAKRSVNFYYKRSRYLSKAAREFLRLMDNGKV